jgi:hypothetical protein
MLVLENSQFHQTEKSGGIFTNSKENINRTSRPESQQQSAEHVGFTDRIHDLLRGKVSKKTLVHSTMRPKQGSNESTNVRGGYNSSIESSKDKISNELYESIIKEHLIRRGCWIPSRFKKFPRFTIFTQKDLT